MARLTKYNKLNIEEMTREDHPHSLWNFCSCGLIGHYTTEYFPLNLEPTVSSLI